MVEPQLPKNAALAAAGHGSWDVLPPADCATAGVAQDREGRSAVVAAAAATDWTIVALLEVSHYYAGQEQSAAGSSERERSHVQIMPEIVSGLQQTQQRSAGLRSPVAITAGKDLRP